MAVLGGSDTLTTATQNLVIAYNSLNKTTQYINGQLTSDACVAASTTLIYHGRSRAVSVNILVSGGTLKLYDSSESSIIPASSLKFALDSAATLGRHEVSAEFKNGIVLVVTGTTTACVVYSVY